jgi:DNA-binding transcriptional LysR family regulator
MPTIPPTTNLLAFEAVARRRSFSQAAIELNLTASAISHQVARLEAQLGVRLFNRNAHGVELSREGESYLSRISGAIGALTAASDDVRKGVGNSLYVHASPSFASL